MSDLINTHRILSLVLPSNEPDTMYKYLLPSISNLSDIAKITTICLNFQPPYLNSQAVEVVEHIESLGFEVNWIYSRYVIEPHKVPINKIRNDAASLCKSLYYGLIDDDMIFNGTSAKMNRRSGIQYLDAIHYMMTHQNCGIMLMGGTLFRRIPRYHIGPVRLDSEYLTSKGFIVKSLGYDSDYPFLPDGSIDLVGSDEEKVLAASRLYQGLYPAKFGNTRVRHYEHKDKCVSGADMYQWNSAKILDENNNKYIKDHYNPDYKGGSSYDVVNHTSYYSNGGIDVYDDSVVTDNTVNYEHMNPITELREIIDLASEFITAN